VAENAAGRGPLIHHAGRYRSLAPEQPPAEPK